MEVNIIRELKDIISDYKVPEDKRVSELLKTNDIIKAACDVKLYKKLMKALPTERRYCRKYIDSVVIFRFLTEKPKDIYKFIDNRLLEKQNLLDNYEPDNEEDYEAKEDLIRYAEDHI